MHTQLCSTVWWSAVQSCLRALSSWRQIFRSGVFRKKFESEFQLNIDESKFIYFTSSRLVDSDFEAPQKWPKDNVKYFVSTTTLILMTKQVSIPINLLDKF